MNKYTVIGLVLMIVLVTGIYGITSIQQVNAETKNLCKGNWYNGKNFKVISMINKNAETVDSAILYSALDSCVAQGYTIFSPDGLVFFAQKKP